MKNKEKYKNEIINFRGGTDFCEEFVMPIILKPLNLMYCNKLDCMQCRLIQAMWLEEEYQKPKEPEVDWAMVKVDTPIYVRDNKNDEWTLKYFAKYCNGNVYSFLFGFTSFTIESSDYIKSWKYAKLADENEVE